MDTFYIYLITLLSENKLRGMNIQRVVIKTKQEIEYYGEPEGRRALQELLPSWLRRIGPIVHVEEGTILDVVVLDKLKG